MSKEEEYFCEYCGYYSQSKERCTSCGRDIADLFTQPISFRLPAWGENAHPSAGAIICRAGLERAA